ncbi:MAG: hypothetical protein J5824_01115 [Lachnospiraceae bacterium]|nr:hypothetical protein [Lachnospiraceae bacterium]
MDHKKTITLKIAAFIMITVILCGYGPFERVPDLVNVGGPFIDLTGTVGESIGNAEEAYEAENAVETPTGIPTDSPTPTITPLPTPTPVEGVTPTPVITPTPIASLRVMVGYDMITNPDKDPAVIVSIDSGRVYENVDEVLAVIAEAAKSKEIVLIDNFAEAETFGRIVRYCEENGIRYTREVRKE